MISTLDRLKMTVKNPKVANIELETMISAIFVGGKEKTFRNVFRRNPYLLQKRKLKPKEIK